MSSKSFTKQILHEFSIFSRFSRIFSNFLMILPEKTPRKSGKTSKKSSKAQRKLENTPLFQNSRTGKKKCFCAYNRCFFPRRRKNLAILGLSIYPFNFEDLGDCFKDKHWKSKTLTREDIFVYRLDGDSQNGSRMKR